MFASNRANDKVTCKSLTGSMGFVGNTPLLWSSERQGSISASFYSAKSFTESIGVDEGTYLREVLRFLVVPIKRPGSTKTILLVWEDMNSLCSTDK